MTTKLSIQSLLERLRVSRDTIVLPAGKRPGPRRVKQTPVASRAGFRPGEPRKARRRPRTDTRVMQHESTALAKRVLDHMKSTQAVYGSKALADVLGISNKKILNVLKNLQAKELVTQHKKSKGWYSR